MKKALITGITGQDGSYLAEFLVSKGYKVFGLVRRSSNDSLVRIRPLVSKGLVTILYGNLRDQGSIRRALEESLPDEIYNLAAQSHVGISFKCPEETMEINYFGLGRLLMEVREIVPKAKIYQASTSEMFGKAKPPQNENTPFGPVSPYAQAKLLAHEDYVVEYRKRFGLFICSGILFNHESPRRGEHFVTRKITISLAKIKLGLQDVLELGNLDAKRDWGYAPDYIRAMWLMLQRKTPEDFVIATGESHTVREFVDEVAKSLEIKIVWHGQGHKEIGKDSNGKTIIKINKDFYRPNEVDFLLGDSTKARNLLKWQPTVTFSDLAGIMANADYSHISSLRIV